MLTVHKFTPVTEREGAAEIVSTDDLLAQGKTLLKSVFGQEGRSVVVRHAALPTFGEWIGYKLNHTLKLASCQPLRVLLPIIDGLLRSRFQVARLHD